MKSILVIPVYKEVLNKNEEMSLLQCIRVLHRHTFCLICSQNLNISAYKKIFNLYDKDFQVELFDEFYFDTIVGYNQLMLSRHFYERFSPWKYILVYQLDAFVFKDEVDYWCSQGYDYIGAPWMKLNGKLDYENSGNGGFSLRKTDSFIELFDHKGQLLTFKGLQCLYRYRGPIRKPFSILMGLFGWHNSLPYFLDDNINEDLFYVTLKHKKGIKFNIPKSDVAMRFSFECNPKLLYELSGNNLPFGCHAWEKHQYDEFWEQFIPTPK